MRWMALLVWPVKCLPCMQSPEWSSDVPKREGCWLGESCKCKSARRGEKPDGLHVARPGHDNQPQKSKTAVSSYQFPHLYTLAWMCSRQCLPTRKLFCTVRSLWADQRREQARQANTTAGFEQGDSGWVEQIVYLAPTKGLS